MSRLLEIDEQVLYLPTRELAKIVQMVILSGQDPKDCIYEIQTMDDVVIKGVPYCDLRQMGC